MDCSGVLQELVDYLDEELSPELVAELEEHLCDCVDCRIVVNTTRKTIEVYRHQEPVPLPEDVSRRLYQALSRQLESTPE